MFSLNAQGGAPTDAQVKAQMQAWGFGNNAVGLNDAQRKGISAYFPNTAGFRDAMVLKPGFEVVKTGLSASGFEAAIDSVLAGG